MADRDSAPAEKPAIVVPARLPHRRRRVGVAGSLLLQSTDAADASSLPAPAVVDEIPAGALVGFVVQLAALQTRAAVRLGALGIESSVKAIATEAPGERLYTIPEVAERLRVPRQHAYELARRELPAVRFGKYVRVRAADLEAWVARHRDVP